MKLLPFQALAFFVVVAVLLLHFANPARAQDPADQIKFPGKGYRLAGSIPDLKAIETQILRQPGLPKQLDKFNWRKLPAALFKNMSPMLGLTILSFLLSGIQVGGQVASVYVSKSEDRALQREYHDFIREMSKYGDKDANKASITETKTSVSNLASPSGRDNPVDLVREIVAQMMKVILETNTPSPDSPSEQSSMFLNMKSNPVNPSVEAPKPDSGNDFTSIPIVTMAGGTTAAVMSMLVMCCVMLVKYKTDMKKSVTRGEPFHFRYARRNEAVGSVESIV